MVFSISAVGILVTLTMRLVDDHDLILQTDPHGLSGVLLQDEIIR